MRIFDKICCIKLLSYDWNPKSLDLWKRETLSIRWDSFSSSLLWNTLSWDSFSLPWNSLSWGGILSQQLQPAASLSTHSRLSSQAAENVKSSDLNWMQGVTNSPSDSGHKCLQKQIQIQIQIQIHIHIQIQLQIQIQIQIQIQTHLQIVDTSVDRRVTPVPSVNLSHYGQPAEWNVRWSESVPKLLYSFDDKSMRRLVSIDTLTICEYQGCDLGLWELMSPQNLNISVYFLWIMSFFPKIMSKSEVPTANFLGRYLHKIWVKSSMSEWKSGQNSA